MGGAVGKDGPGTKMRWDDLIGWGLKHKNWGEWGEGWTQRPSLCHAQLGHTDLGECNSVMQRGQMVSRGGLMHKPEVAGMLLEVSDRCMCMCREGYNNDRKNYLLLGQQDGSSGKGAVGKPDYPSSILSVYMVGGENQLPQAVL